MPSHDSGPLKGGTPLDHRVNILSYSTPLKGGTLPTESHQTFNTEPFSCKVNQIQDTQMLLS